MNRKLQSKPVKKHIDHTNQRHKRHPKHNTSKVLFILKRRLDYSLCPSYSAVGVSTGLYNSAKFVSDMLNDNDIESKVIVVNDNNDIDREVTAYNPSHVIIEALWVVPDKFDVLTRLHPTVNWIVRMHSETPFIASEGVAMKWLLNYLTYPRVTIACNAPRFLRELTFLEQEKYGENAEDKMTYLPNFYDVGHPTARKFDRKKTHVDIGCFGAIRPLKNQLLQAVAALEFASIVGKKLKFHINVGRIEMKGDPILHNIINLFEELKDQGHELVMHKWMPHEQFIDLVKTMDLGLQVAYSETFNIVTADLVSQGVPIIGSKEIPWLSNIFCAEPSESNDIVDKMLLAWEWRKFNVWLNAFTLRNYCETSRDLWMDYFSGED